MRSKHQNARFAIMLSNEKSEAAQSEDCEWNGFVRTSEVATTIPALFNKHFPNVPLVGLGSIHPISLYGADACVDFNNDELDCGIMILSY